ncbi:MAG: transporter substrate-binding domain-containing protein [Spirochaetes bacterium]|nr:transporter substrate-binding domain-containing protein [Spirochaetota bacterium]
MRKFIITFSVLIFILCSLQSQTLELFTEEDPPYSFTDQNGKPAGFGVEIVTEIQKRLKTNFPINIVPWTRAYKIITEENNKVVFTMTRTKERESLFQWIGPIVENDWVFVAKEGSGIHISCLDDAKKITRIGTVNNYAWTQYLEKQGFQNLEKVTERKLNIFKIEKNRIKVFVSADSSYKSAVLEGGYNPDDYEIIYRFNTVQMYIAFSRNTKREVTKKWQSALDSMKKDGTFEKILKKWLPENKMPTATILPNF